MTVWFFTLSYMAFTQNKYFADEMQLSYTKFHTWGIKHIPFKLPSPQVILPYKSKVAMLLGYLWIVLSLSTLLGFKQGTYLLLVMHGLYTLIYDNPALTHTINSYERQLRACFFDAMIAATLIMIAGWNHGDEP